jgi:hypothetical protein
VARISTDQASDASMGLGTIALDTNASGNRTMNPREAADSGLLLSGPTHAATHDSE